MAWLFALLGLFTTFAVTRGGSSVDSTETVGLKSNDRAGDGSSAGFAVILDADDNAQAEEADELEEVDTVADEDFEITLVEPTEDIIGREPRDSREPQEARPDQNDDEASGAGDSEVPQFQTPASEDIWASPDFTPVEEPEDEQPANGELVDEPVILAPSPPPSPAPEPEDSDAEETSNLGNIFVATDGRDNGAGTIDDPLASIERAVAMANPGDVILVRGGTYEGTVHISKGGEEGAPVKIMGYPGERPIIDGSGTSPDTDLVLISDAHVHFEGFEVTGATRTGIAVWSTHDVTIADNVIHDTVRGGIWIGSDRLGESYGHVIEGNDVFNTALENEAKVWDSGWPRAIAVDVSTDTVVQDNLVFKNYGEGLGGLSSSRVQYLDNIAYDNYSVQIYFDNTQDITAEGNILFHTGDEEFFRDGEPGVGILVANEYTQYELATTRLLIQENTFAGVEPVYYDGSYGWGGGISDSVLGPNEVLSADEVEEEWLAPETLFV